MFLNIIVSIGCTFISFHSYKPAESINLYPLFVSRYPGRQERNLKTKLYMHSTIGDVALTNINRETNYFHDFVRYLKSCLHGTN